MKTYNQKINGKKNRWTQACFGKSTIMREFLKEDLRQEAGCFKASQGDKQGSEWQQRFNRWWDLTFGQEGRYQKVTGEVFMLLGILGTRPRMTKVESLGSLW